MNHMKYISIYIDYSKHTNSILTTLKYIKSIQVKYIYIALFTSWTT